MAWDSDADIRGIFAKFGYTPSAQEISALRPAFTAGEGLSQAQGGSVAMSAVANYVIAHQALNGAESKITGQLTGDQAQQAEYQKLGKQYGEQGTSNLQAAADIYKQAPELFGGLDQNQISQYLAPLQSQFNTQLGTVQGAQASRGLAGSSMEATAMSQVQQQYQQQVLQQALQLGIQQQQSRSQALQTMGQGQLGLSGQFTGAGTQYGSLISQLLGMNTSLAEDQAQLPSQMANQGIAQGAAIQALNPKQTSPWGSLIGTGLGAVAGSYGGPVGAGIGASIGGSIGSAVTGNPAGAQAGNQLGNAGILAALLGKSGGMGGSGGGLPTWGQTFGGWGNLFGNSGGNTPKGNNTGLIDSSGWANA